jgi:hypothetical protein
LSWVVSSAPRTAEIRAELNEIAALITVDLQDALSHIARITSPDKHPAAKK